MKMFGVDNIEWRDAQGETHVLVAVKRGGWEHLCRATPDNYVDGDFSHGEEKSSVEAVVWRHDQVKITCNGCLAVLDGAVVTKVPVKL